MSNLQIVLNNISFKLPESNPIFNQTSFSFGQKKYGIVGKNGIGKTTLLKLISGELLPSIGSVHRHGSVAVVPQLHTCFGEEETVGQVLGVASILGAIQRIHACKNRFIINKVTIQSAS